MGLKREDTRLRDWNINLGKACRWKLYTWKEKILDYEIETIIEPITPDNTGELTWKEKILDYEIETLEFDAVATRPHFAWKEKILDYEIETWFPLHSLSPRVHLKREDTRLRDWNSILPSLMAFALTTLKREDTRLRDWNITTDGGEHRQTTLEKRRYSITRLKRGGCFKCYGWFASLEKRRYSITRLKLYSRNAEPFT